MTDYPPLWKTLFDVAPIRPRKPRATLYEVIVDLQDLELAKQYVEGGHAISQRFGGGDSLSLAAKHGDMEFVRFFFENADTSKGTSTLMWSVIERPVQF